MDEDNNILFVSKTSKKKKDNILRFKNKKLFKKNLYKKSYNFLLLFPFILIIIIFFIIILYLINRNSRTIKFDLEKMHDVYKYSLKYDEFDENINAQYIQLQNYFCEKQDKNTNDDYEKKIKLAKVNFLGKNYDMIVYKILDDVSESIIKFHHWEKEHTKKVLTALEYYANKTKLESKDIYLIDIGSNIGWYSYYIGKYGYKIFAFEANKLNSYILHKNYCINKDVNITIINKGLDKEEKFCTLKTMLHNNGNGMILCEKRDKFFSFHGEVYNDIELTKLSKYVKYLSKKNIAFIKMDVEGCEGNVIEGGKELISKYHVPFIMMEFAIRILEIHKTNVLEFNKAHQLRKRCRN